MSIEYTIMIHRFEESLIMGDAEEYEEHTNRQSAERRVDWLNSRVDGFSYWAEDANGNIYPGG